MKLLVLSPFLYHSGVAHGGGSISFQQLKLMAARHEVHFLSFVHNETQEVILNAQNELKELCKTATHVRIDVGFKKKVIAKLCLLLKLFPVDAVLYQSDSMRSELLRLIDSIKPDVVFIQFPQMAQYIAVCRGVATVLDVQDAFSISAFRRFRSQKGLVRKLIKFLNWIAWLFYEIRTYKKFNVVATLTHQDRIGLEIFSPGLNAVVSQAAIALPNIIADVTASSKDIAFVGAFTHAPNVEAVAYFIREIFPLILEREPAARFFVAGKNPPEQLLSLSSESIQFVGFVPDISSFMRSAAVVVVPLLSGGGIKIKTLEAMASGCSVVSTSIGAEEIGAKHKEHFFVADNPEEFAELVVKLLRDPNIGRTVGGNARQFVMDNFSLYSKMNSLEAILNLAIEQNRSHNGNRVGITSASTKLGANHE